MEDLIHLDLRDFRTPIDQDRVVEVQEPVPEDLMCEATEEHDHIASDDPEADEDSEVDWESEETDEFGKIYRGALMF